MKAATAVDYATGILVYDNFDIVQKLVDLVVLQNIREELKSELQMTLMFLKFQFKEHVKSNDGNSGHNTVYGLKISDGTEENSLHTCFPYQFPLKFLYKLKQHVDPMHHNILEDCKEKVILYMGHIVRVINQRSNIKIGMTEILKAKKKRVCMDSC